MKQWSVVNGQWSVVSGQWSENKEGVGGAIAAMTGGVTGLG
jgi:hypothetical protein